MQSYRANHRNGVGMLSCGAKRSSDPQAEKWAVSDAQQLQRLKNGDREAFAALVREHHRALVGLATPLVGRADAEEVVQNAWLKAHRAIARFEGRSQLRTWLARIVINEAKMLLRRRGRELLVGDWSASDNPGDPLAERFKPRGGWQHPPAVWDTDSPDELLAREQLADCLDRLLQTMPANQRALLELRDASGMSFDAICNELSLSASNARVTLHRARAQLFKLVDHYQETGEC